MGTRHRRQSIELTVLDAITLGVIPTKHRAAAIAAAMLRNSSYFSPRTQLERLSKLIMDDQEGAIALVEDVLQEMSRQLKIRARRVSLRRRLNKVLEMGLQADRGVRINRVCQYLFGDPSEWGFSGPVCPKITKPYFNWFKQMPDGVLVAGIEGLLRSELRTGFVFSITKESTTWFAMLPTKARDVRSLLTFLGLHPRLASSKSITVNWMRRTFVIDGINHLPWVYP